MRIVEITAYQPVYEAQEWTKFTGQSSSRVWFNPNTKQAITTSDDGNHSIGIMKNMELFGVTPEDLQAAGMQPGEQVLDYNGRVMIAAMNKGWVRIRVDPRQPDLESNIEGTDLRTMRRAFVWYCEQVGTPMRIILVLRHGPADKDGTAIVLRNADEIKAFHKFGRLPQGHDPALVRPMNTTPHFFRNVGGS